MASDRRNALVTRTWIVDWVISYTGMLKPAAIDGKKLATSTSIRTRRRSLPSGGRRRTSSAEKAAAAPGAGDEQPVADPPRDDAVVVFDRVLGPAEAQQRQRPAEQHDRRLSAS